MPIQTELTSFGYRSAFFGHVTGEDLQTWVEHVRLICARGYRWGRLVDCSGLLDCGGPDGDPASALGRLLADTVGLDREQGLIRSAVVVAGAAVAAAAMQQAFVTGAYAWERYIDASTDSDWERTALDWIEHGLDPDRGPLPADVAVATHASEA